MCYLGFPPNQAPAAPEARSPPPEQEQVPATREPAFSDYFMVWCFKVVECDNPEHTREDWETCPFAHVGEVVVRRPPQTHLPKLCPKARRACRKGRACPYAHNVFEHWLHPARYKTEICEHGTSCDRPMCFFAHTPEEIRHPSPSADEVMAAAEAAGLLGRSHSNGGGAAAHCGRPAAGPSCTYAPPSCGRRADMGFAGGAPGGMRAAWAGALQSAQLQATVQAAQVQAQAQLLDQLGADLLLLQAQQQVAAAQQARQQAAAAAAAAAASLSSGWASSDWSILSSGSSSPTALLPTPHDASPPGIALGRAFGSSSPPLQARGAAAAATAFDIWGPERGAALPAGGASAPAAAARGISAEDALMMLTGLPCGGGAAPANYLCALQAQQARMGLGAAPAFF